MRAFNLAETRIVERNYCQTHISRRLRIIGLMIILAASICGASYTCRAMFAGEVKETKSKLAEAQGRGAEAKLEMQLLNTHVSERKWQAQLAAESGRWLDVLNSVIARVPPDVWLDSVKNSAAESRVSVSGRAASFDAIVAFISALRCAKGFGEVRLESAKTAGSGEVNCVDFTLGVALKEGSQPTPAQSTTPATAPPSPPPAAAQPSGGPPDRGQPAPTRGGVPNAQGSS
jgi:hypothetical protein